MKNLLEISEVKWLNKNEQRIINGGWDSGYCARLFASGNCENPNWESCNLPLDFESCR